MNKINYSDNIKEPEHIQKRMAAWIKSKERITSEDEQKLLCKCIEHFKERIWNGLLFNYNYSITLIKKLPGSARTDLDMYESSCVRIDKI